MSASKKEFNKYEVQGDTTIIFLENRKGEIFKTYIDTEDLEKIKEIGVHWYPQWLKNPKSYYVSATQYINTVDGKPKYKIWKLHRVIMNAQEEDTVDHIDHDSLNNKKENLRVTNINKNTKHRKGKNSNNTSGYRNVSWINKEKVWRVQLQIDGKNTKLKDFPSDKVDEAGAYAEEMRIKYYKDFKGNS